MQHDTFRSALQSRLDRTLLGCVNLWGLVRHVRQARYYRSLSGRWPNLAFPRTANDKFFWRKVFDRDPRLTTMCDKIAAKDWVRARVPDLDIPEVLWAGTDPAALPPDVLTGNVVVKVNHGWNTNYFIHDGQHDREALEQSARAWLRRRHGRERFEHAYFDVPPRLFVEEMVRPADGEKLQELKVYTFGARVERVFHGLDRQGDHLANVWEVAADGTLPSAPRPSSLGIEGTHLPLPACTARAMAIARRLGSEFDHIRVDFMTTGERLWLGEMTVYNLAGHLTHGGTDPDSPGSRAWDLRCSGFLRDPPQKGWRAGYARALKRQLDRLGSAADGNSGRIDVW